MVTAYFSSIHHILLKALCEAKFSIDIAVAWFTNESLFTAILQKLDNGLKVRLVMINDDINHCSNLNLQRFIDKGGLLYFGRNGFFMHNKYCIIDGITVFTGSYNYTYFAEHSNFENIVCISEDQNAVAAFINNYNLIISHSNRATDLESFLQNHPYMVNVHASRQVRIRDAYQKANELIDENKHERAEEVLMKLGLQEYPSDAFIIKDVQYKNWQPGYNIGYIEVTPTEVIIEISIDLPKERSFLVCGPGLDRSWNIVGPDGTIIYAKSVSIRLNGNTFEEIPENYQVKYHTAGNYEGISFFDRAHSRTSGTPSNTATRTAPEECSIVFFRLRFPKGDYIHGIVDLFEGAEEYRIKDNHWHFLRIDLAINHETAKVY